jgi:hypothetical protein
LVGVVDGSSFGSLGVGKEFLPTAVAFEGFQRRQGRVARQSPNLARALEAALVLIAD